MKHLASASLLLALLAPAQTIPPSNDAGRFETGPLAKLPLTATQHDLIRNAIGKGDYKQAERILVQQIESHPGSAGLLGFAARLFLFDRDPLNAAIAFAKADKIEPLEPADRLSLAVAYIGIGKAVWAREQLNRVASADPANNTAQYWLARLDYDDRLYDSAVQRFEKVIRADPKSVRAWDSLALAQEGAGKLDDAIVSYQRAVEYNRQAVHPSAWPPLNLGILLTRLNRTEEGHALLLEAARLDPQMAAAQYRLGVSWQKQGDLEESRRALQKAVDLDPSDPSPLYSLSQVLRAKGDTAAADSALRKFQELKKLKRGDPAANVSKNTNAR